MLSYFIEKYLKNRNISKFMVTDGCLDLINDELNFNIKGNFLFIHDFSMMFLCSDPRFDFSQRLEIKSANNFYSYERSKMKFDISYNDYEMANFVHLHSDYIHVHQTSIEIIRPVLQNNDVEVFSSFLRYKLITPY